MIIDALSFIRELFAQAGVLRIGVCRFADALPLINCRAARRLPEEAKSIIACALPYYPGAYPQRNVALYSVCDDYHAAAGYLLNGICASLENAFEGCRFVPFVDVSPIREVCAAHLAGLGRIGLHRQLIVPDYGAYVFIGCVVTDMELEPSRSAKASCSGCGACLTACPSGALSPGGLDSERCRSAVTQKKGELSGAQAEEIRLGGMAWGCDICLEACPMNRGVPITPINALRKNPVPILGYENLDEMIAVKSYGYRGKSVLERNLRIIRRKEP